MNNVVTSSLFCFSHDCTPPLYQSRPFTAPISTPRVHFHHTCTHLCHYSFTKRLTLSSHLPLPLLLPRFLFDHTMAASTYFSSPLATALDTPDAPSQNGHIDPAGAVGLRIALAFLIIMLGGAVFGTLFFLWKRSRAPKKLVSVPEPEHAFTMHDLAQRDLEAQRPVGRRTFSGKTEITVGSAESPLRLHTLR